MPYDLFISYSRKDNRNHRITELKDRIAADYLAFSGEELRCFFDLDDIHGMDDWRHRILEGLRESSLLLLVLSPGYLASEYCEWEIVEYLKYEHSRAAAGQGVAPVYFVEVPGLDTPGFEQAAAAWVARVRRRNHFDLRPWHDEGVEALKREDVRTRLKALEETLHSSIAKMRRIANAPGNLASHNPHFVGRETEMLRLHEAAGLGRFGVLTALQGMGGLGKTALAIQYAYAYADFYPGGRWLVGCAGKTSLAAIIRELDADLGITFTDEEKGDDTRAARRVLAELETRARNGAAARAGEKDPPQPRALLLLDNVDDPALLQTPQADLISGRRWLHVIATTRLANDELGYDPDHRTLLSVDELPLEDAVRLIESHQPGGSFPNDAERAAAHDLAALLGGFTLAVEVVAVHLGERFGQITCAAFSDRLRREGLGGLEIAAKATRSAVSHRQKLIGATLGPTLDLLGPEESLVLAYAALLPPDTIPLPWLRALVAKDHPALGQDAAPGYDDPWLSLVNHLLGLRLFQVMEIAPDNHAPRLVRMHRLVAELVRDRGEPKGQGSAPLDCVVNLALERSELLGGFWFKAEAKWEIEPLILLADSMLRLKHASAPKLVKHIGQWHFNTGDMTRCESLHRRALELLSLMRPSDEREVAILSSNLGAILNNKGHFSEAESFLRQALDIDERLRHSDHPFIQIRLNNLALLLSRKGDHAGAQRLYEHAIKASERVLGAEHLSTLASVNNLAELLASKGDYAGAQPLFERVLKTCERLLGAEHPTTLVSLNNLALLLMHTGRFAEIEPLLRRSMEGRRKVFGPMHPGTANGLAGYAMVLARLNRDSEAESFAREALKIWCQSSVPEDALSGKAHWVIGTVTARRGDSVAAKEHLKDALWLLLKGHGEQHPWIVAIQREIEDLT